jgi:RNA polymerase sigma-70 factor, ECF subfamily
MITAELELWVIDAKSGNSSAFNRLCQHFHPSLLRYSYKLCDNKTLAQDAVQNSWLKVIKSLHQLQDPRAFRSWLFQTVHRQTLDLLKQQQKSKLRFSDQELDLCASGATSSATYHASAEHSITQALASLTAIDQQAIHLFYLEQMSLKEISIVLDIPTGTVKSRLNRARKSLKQQLLSNDATYSDHNQELLK